MEAVKWRCKMCGAVLPFPLGAKVAVKCHACLTVNAPVGVKVEPGDTRRRWTCTNCGVVAPWGEGWVWWPMAEIRTRWQDPIPGHIACSRVCRDALVSKYGLDDFPNNGPEGI